MVKGQKTLEGNSTCCGNCHLKSNFHRNESLGVCPKIHLLIRRKYTVIKFVKRTTQKFRIDANLRDTFGTRVSGKHKSLVRADPG